MPGKRHPGAPWSGPVFGDFDPEELVADWEATEERVVEGLRQALPRQRRAPRPEAMLGEACRHLRAGLASGRPPFDVIRRAAALDPRSLPEDDVELWLEAAGALVVPGDETGLGEEVEADLLALGYGEWVGAVLGLVRAGAGAPAEPAAVVATIASCSEVKGRVQLDDVVERAFEPVVAVWQAVRAVDEGRRLTALGAWGLPHALARALGSSLDPDPGETR